MSVDREAMREVLSDFAVDISDEGEADFTEYLDRLEACVTPSRTEIEHANDMFRAGEMYAMQYARARAAEAKLAAVRDVVSKTHPADHDPRIDAILRGES